MANIKYNKGYLDGAKEAINLVNEKFKAIKPVASCKKAGIME